MNKWTTIYLILFPITILAQVTIKNTSLIDPQLNILYRGVANRVEVLGLDKNTTLKLISATGQVHNSKWKRDTNSFYIKAGFADIDTLRLYQAAKLILTRIYEVKKIGNPIPQLGNIMDSSATIQQILENPKLNVVIPDCYLDHGFRVFYFNLTCLHATGDTIKTFETTNGNLMTKKQTKTIANLTSGNKISFTDIYTTCPDCNMRPLAPIMISIK